MSARFRLKGKPIFDTENRVKENMTILCKKLFPKDYKALSDKMILYKSLAGPASVGSGEEQTDSDAPSCDTVHEYRERIPPGQPSIVCS